MPTIVKLSPLDMLKACCHPEFQRYDMRLPFAAGQYAYGTDARISLRIPVVELLSLPENDSKHLPPVLTLAWDRSMFSDQPLDIPLNLPEPQMVACDCRDKPKHFWSTCDDCKGSGQVSDERTRRVVLALGFDVALKYARLLQTLGAGPLYLKKIIHRGEAPQFTFTTAHNGVGLLMGMRPK